VILGILSLDRSSFLNAATPWTPATPSFACGDFLRMAGALENMPAGDEAEEQDEEVPEVELPENELTGDA
jgi:hypothetical protein